MTRQHIPDMNQPLLHVPPTCHLPTPPSPSPLAPHSPSLCYFLPGRHLILSPPSLPPSLPPFFLPLFPILLPPLPLSPSPPPPPPSLPTCQLDVPILMQEQVFGLEVPVNDSLLVAVVHSQHNLTELLPGFFLRHAAILDQILCVCVCVLNGAHYMYICGGDRKSSASYPGPHAERGSGPGDTRQNSRMCRG